MAENKKSFILYADLIHTVRKMPKDKAGDLFLTILSYVNDENPIVEDMVVDLVFEPIKRQMKRDLEKYEITKDKKSNSGVIGNLKRWHIDLYEKLNNNEITLEEAKFIAESRKISHTDTSPSDTIALIAVNDTVNVIDTVTVTDNGKEETISSAEEIKKNKISAKEIEEQFPITTAENKTKQPAVKKQKKEITLENSSLYQNCIEEYNKFCLIRNNLGAKIDSRSGKAMNQIIARLKSRVNDAEKENEQILSAWKFILSNFLKWSSYHQGQIELYEIERNLSNILTIINPKNKTNDKPKFAKSTDETRREIEELEFNRNLRHNQTLSDSQTKRI